jgi:hypothetical protein
MSCCLPCLVLHTPSVPLTICTSNSPNTHPHTRPALTDNSTLLSPQGREKDVAFFSTVRSQRGSRGIGFVADERRINVGLTRARWGGRVGRDVVWVCGGGWRKATPCADSSTSLAVFVCVHSRSGRAEASRCMCVCVCLREDLGKAIRVLCRLARWHRWHTSPTCSPSLLWCLCFNVCFNVCSNVCACRATLILVGHVESLQGNPRWSALVSHARKSRCMYKAGGAGGGGPGDCGGTWLGGSVSMCKGWALAVVVHRVPSLSCLAGRDGNPAVCPPTSQATSSPLLLAHPCSPQARWCLSG